MKSLTGIAALVIGLNSSPTFADTNSAQQTSKYAVLLIDAKYSPNERPNLVNIDEELENMSEVLKKANATDTPVFEVNYLSFS